jgi:hypothetical protein
MHAAEHAMGMYILAALFLFGALVSACVALLVV